MRFMIKLRKSERRKENIIQQFWFSVKNQSFLVPISIKDTRQKPRICVLYFSVIHQSIMFWLFDVKPRFESSNCSIRFIEVCQAFGTWCICTRHTEKNLKILFDVSAWSGRGLHLDWCHPSFGNNISRKNNIQYRDSVSFNECSIIHILDSFKETSFPSPCVS